jgi:glutathione-regulated potassium-efflux system ancillary protein KefG
VNTIVVLFAHPSLEKSRIQRAWLQAIGDLQGVLIRDLYQLYPEFDIDVRAEQRALEAHDIIVLQHPLYWYSTPALLKQYQDLVLEYGWAYGTGGVALTGKKFLSAISMGGQREAYEHGGFHDITVTDSGRTC